MIWFPHAATPGGLAMRVSCGPLLLTIYVVAALLAEGNGGSLLVANALSALVVVCCGSVGPAVLGRAAAPSRKIVSRREDLVFSLPCIVVSALALWAFVFFGTLWVAIAAGVAGTFLAGYVVFIWPRGRHEVVKAAG
jgi:hypothetical protein